MLFVQGVEKRFPTRSGELVVLSDVSLAADAGKSIAIMGPSGSGKSTLLNILGALEPPSAGIVRLDDCEPFTLGEPQLARFRNQRVGFVFQEHHLLPQCSALENVLLPTLVANERGDAPDRARQLLERVGLAERWDHLPAELSGGERQRVAVARALINQPRLLLADEPTGNLDRATAQTVMALLDELHADDDFLLIMVTHNEALVEAFNSRYDLVDGTLDLR